MKLLTAGALAALAILASGCSGCSTVSAALSNDHAVLQGQKIDEQAMGSVDALGSSANVLIEAAAKSGLATRDQLLLAKDIRAKMDAAHDAAYAAYTAGDAVTFSAKLAAVTDLNKKATKLFDEVRK